MVDYFSEIFGQPVPAGFLPRELDSFDLRLQALPDYEAEQAIIDMVNFLLSNHPKSGSEYLERWEKGWAENRKAFEARRDLRTLVPKYITKNTVFRLGGQFFSSPNRFFEADLARVIVTHYVSKYLSSVDAIVDLGSGSCHYTYWMAKRFPNKSFYALDWSSESNYIADLIGAELGNVTGVKFDMFNPGPLNFGPSKGLITVGALEQIGEGFTPVLNWIRSSKFETVIHLEPVLEFYNPNSVVDFLSIEYLKKRDWLRGYLPFLEKQERKGEIEILEKQRIFGSKYHETYNALVWRVR